MSEEPRAENLLNMLNNVDVDKVGSVLKEFEKYEKLLDKVSGIVMRLNRIGVLPAVLRIAGQKSGIPDIDKPLPVISPLSVEASSSTHLLMYKELNKQPEEVIGEMFRQAMIAGEGQKEKGERQKAKGKRKPLAPTP